MSRNALIIDRKVYEQTTGYDESGDAVAYVSIIDTMDDNTVNYYMIPHSIWQTNEERMGFISRAREMNQGRPKFLMFPAIHSHYTFDLMAGGYGTYQRTLEQTQQMVRRSTRTSHSNGQVVRTVDRKQLSKEKKEHSRSSPDGNYTAMKAAVTDLLSQVKSLRSYDDSLREKAKSLKDHLYEIRKSMTNGQFDELLNILRQIHEILSKIRNEEEGANKRKIEPIVNTAIDQVARSTDLRASRKQLIEASKQLNGMRLPREDRQRLRLRIDEAFKELERKESKQKGDLEGKQYAEYVRVKDLVEKVVPNVGVVSDLRAFKQSLREVQEQVRNANLAYKDRDSLMKRINSAYEIINQRIDKQRREQEQHANVAYSNLVSKIDSLASTASYTNDFGSIRNALSQARNEVFAIKGLKREQRDTLIRKINSAFETLKSRQMAAKAQRDREYNERKAKQQQEREQRQRENQERRERQNREYQERKERQQRQKEERERKERENKERKERQQRERAERERKNKENRERNNRNKNKRR